MDAALAPVGTVLPRPGLTVRLGAALLDGRPHLARAIRQHLEAEGAEWPGGPYLVALVVTDDQGFEVDVHPADDIEALSAAGAARLDGALQFVEDEATAAVDALVFTDDSVLAQYAAEQRQ